MRQIALIVTILALSACSLAWGRSFTMVGSGQDYVKYKYYLATVNEGGMNLEARDYCSVYQKNAVLQSREPATSNSTDEMINTYQCVQPIVFVPVLNPMPTR